jgi:hypothetical protein
MAALLFLVTVGIGPPPPAAEPLLPLSLALFEPRGLSPDEVPGLDELWPVLWLDVCLLERERDAFWWPDVAILSRHDIDARGERGEAHFPGRLELGLLRLQQMEAEPRFFPAAVRVVFGLPLGLVEAVTWAVVPNTVSVNGKEVFNQAASTQDLAAHWAHAFVKAETKFLAGLRTSEINTFGAQMGTEEPERDRFTRLQWRALFTATKNAYRERYQIPALDLDTVLGAVSTGNWVDFVVVPTVVSFYAARFGIERKIRISDDVRMEFRIEKATRFQKVMTSDHGGRLVSASVNLFRLPLSFIVSVEAAPHGVQYEFIGIGTDLGAALSGITSGKPREMRDFR